MHYFVCGFMACGKSTYLEEALNNPKYFGYSIADLDSLIFEKYRIEHSDLSSLIKDKGFSWFREKEYETLESIWSGGNSFTALGGGSLTKEVLELIESRKDIKGYYLETDFDICFERLKRTNTRPLGQLSRQELQKLYLERKKDYKKFETLS